MQLTPDYNRWSNWDGIQFETGWPNLINHEARTDGAMALVEAVRRRAYAQAGVLSPGMPLRDRFDEDKEHCRVFVLCDQGEPAGTVRTSLGTVEDGGRSTPFGSVFASALKMRAGCVRYVEAGRLAVIAPELRPDPRRVFAVVQNVTAAADEAATPFIIAPTRSDHTRFYETLGFDVLVPAAWYPGMPQMVTLLALDWEQRREAILAHRRHRYICSTRNHGWARSDDIRLGTAAA